MIAEMIPPVSQYGAVICINPLPGSRIAEPHCVVERPGGSSVLSGCAPCASTSPNNDTQKFQMRSESQPTDLFLDALKSWSVEPLPFNLA